MQLYFCEAGRVRVFVGMGGDRGGGACKIIGFWDVTLCRLVGRHQHFRASCISEHLLQ